MINNSWFKSTRMPGDEERNDFVVIYSRNRELYGVTVKNCISGNEAVEKLKQHIAKVKAGNPFLTGKVKIHDRMLKHNFNEDRSLLDHDWIDDPEAYL